MKPSNGTKTALLACIALLSARAGAFEADQVTIKQAHSFNSGTHMWFEISANSNCTTPTAYFILQRWDDQAEPLKTQRQVMYQMAMTALVAGKRVRVIGANCYLNQYLFADQITIYD